MFNQIVGRTLDRSGHTGRAQEARAPSVVLPAPRSPSSVTTMPGRDVRSDHRARVQRRGGIAQRKVHRTPRPALDSPNAAEWKSLT
jgi:hypothetical protein